MLSHQASLFDAHTHCFPCGLEQSARAWAQQQREPHWANLVEPIGRASIQGWSDLQQMLDHMDAAGVEKACLLGWYWENEATCLWHNQLMANWLQAAPDRLVAFAAILPNAQVLEQLERARDQGFCGVGELHPGVQGFSSADPHWRTLADWCVSQQWPVNLHATEAAGATLRDRVATPLQDFVVMAEQHPLLTLILAHWGGGLPFFENNQRLKKRLNKVYYDTSASPLLYAPTVFRQVIDAVGIDKIIFGSDYPLKLFPKQQKDAEMQTYVDYLMSELDLTATEQQAIFAENFTKILPVGFV